MRYLAVAVSIPAFIKAIQIFMEYVAFCFCIVCYGPRHYPPAQNVTMRRIKLLLSQNVHSEPGFRFFILGYRTIKRLLLYTTIYFTLNKILKIIAKDLCMPPCYICKTEYNNIMVHTSKRVCAMESIQHSLRGNFTRCQLRPDV